MDIISHISSIDHSYEDHSLENVWVSLIEINPMEIIYIDNTQIKIVHMEIIVQRRDHANMERSLPLRLLTCRLVTLRSVT